MTEVLHHQLTSGDPAGVAVFEAVRGADTKARVFLRKGAALSRFDLRGAAAEGRACQLLAAKSLSGGTMLTFGLAAPNAPLSVPLTHGGEVEVQAITEDCALFTGLNAAMVQRNGETREVLQEWLRYHAEDHGLEAAVVLDRGRLTQVLRDVDALEKALKKHPIAGLKRLLIVSCDQPLGQINLGPEAHPMNAPDAPGKDRMDAPAPDPWSSPLGELLVYEALKWRYLRDARAVASLELTDLLAPVQGPGLFAQVQDVPSGVIALLGQRTYPWRVRKGDQPRFADHICAQFDNPGGNRRWIVAPALAGLDEPWRLVRVGSVTPDAEAVGRFYRCMAVRSPDANASELVPKTSLVLNDDLLRLSRKRFGHKPVLPPQTADHGALSLPASVPGRTAIVTCMKNEGPFILEWIAYHRAIGVDDFLVYTNDCTDGTDTLLDLLQSHGILQHRDNPFRTMVDMKPQHAALLSAESEPIMQRAGWGICMDVDEFINIHVGDGTLRALYDAVGDANMISLTWRLFGNSDLHDFIDTPTPGRFSRCAPELIRKPHQAWGFKTLFRNIGIFKKLGVHRPKGLKPDLWEQITWVNGSGQQMPKEMLRNGWRSTTETYGYDMVTLNHYAVRDAESFLVKRDRGRANHVERDQGLGYWFRMNHNAQTDTSIMRMLPALEAELDKLKALPGVAEQHAKCVATHRNRIAELRSGDAYEGFYQEITGARMERLSRMQHHFGSNVFLAGPDSVPDEVAMADHPDDFFFTVEEVDETVH